MKHLPAIIVSLVLGTITISALGDDIPPGSYRDSCRNSRVDGQTLFGTCRTISGSWVTTQLDNYVACQGDISNIDGTLTCPRINAAAPDGSFRQTCRNIFVDDTTLLASCRNLAGDWVSTSLGDFSSCRGEVYNSDGILSCDRGSADSPLGSYRQSCRDIIVDDTTLRASCRNMAGGWVQNSFGDFSSCRGNISNSDGALSCDKGSVDAPTGSYKLTCRSIISEPETVDATCRNLAGEWIRSELSNLSGCKSAIANVDGFLTCERGTASAPPGSYKQSCRDIAVDQALLTATCKRRAGDWQSAQLSSFERCTKDIANGDGTLTCLTWMPATMVACNVWVTATSDRCFNLDGTPSDFYTPGTLGARACGPTRELAERAARDGLSLRNCLTTDEEARGGCCTVRFE